MTFCVSLLHAAPIHTLDIALQLLLALYIRFCGASLHMSAHALRSSDLL